MDEILKLVEEYIKEKDSKKEWVAGRDLVQYAGNYFDEKEYVAAVKTLLGGWLVLGQEGIRFESRFPKRLGKKLGILTNSGSSANLLMLAALTSKRGMNLPKGTKVLTPIAGFPTTINPILQLGFTPVFVDIELDSLNLDLNQVEQKLKEEIKALEYRKLWDDVNQKENTDFAVRWFKDKKSEDKLGTSKKDLINTRKKIKVLKNILEKDSLDRVPSQIQTL